jgi:hypothetical protein
MTRPHTPEREHTVFIACKASRENYHTLIGTPDALRKLSDSLSASLTALPASLESARDLPLDGVVTADAEGSHRETYLTIRAEPSLAWLVSRRQRRVRRDWLVTTLLVAAAGFAVFGFGMFVRYIFTHVI